MNYFLAKLKFETAVHFGVSDSALSLYTSDDHFRADTLFSALCHTALNRDGAAGLDRLIGLAKEGQLRLSDSMPWRGDDLYLPKPVIAAESSREVPSDLRKAVKKLAWLPARSMAAFSESLHGGEPYRPEADAGSFGRVTERTFAAVPEEGDAVPYQVGLYQFRENCGLYVLLETESRADGEWVLDLIGLLGLTGIGGKTSAGFGTFSVQQPVRLNDAADEQGGWLYAALMRTEGAQLLLTSSLPRDEELDAVLDGATFQLVRRGGFVASDTYAETAQKKKTQVFLAAGAVLPRRFEGDLYEVGCGGGHPVWRYAKPILLGVSL